ncbi:hypothetical protein [Sphingomonas sp. 35-24ZXX]|uniref:hypothetical protein n=1 Tax=Sphingomonas sp. 35-24ZXX TaxID=1545915 RepID=UPI00053BF835|nr:hypothetical protein [Sphingomonas sp. 35-24ZXX]
MNNVIQFPTAADREHRQAERAAADCDAETMMRLACGAQDATVRTEAARWMLEVLAVKVSA